MFVAMKLLIITLLSIVIHFKTIAENVAIDSPEGWGMSYQTAATLNLGDGIIPDLEIGEFYLSGEVSTIPKLNADQQKIGFGGFKYEDLNKSPVFGRGKVSSGFYWNSILELTWTPSLEINGAQPKGLWGFSWAKNFVKNDDVVLGFRYFKLNGSATADVTCSADVVAAPLYSPENISGCVGLSSDKINFGHNGLELVLSPAQKTQPMPWVSYARSNISPSVHIDAPLELINERAFVETSGTLNSFSIGVNYFLTDQWRLNISSSYTPLDIKRSEPAGGNDNFWNFRVGLSWKPATN